MILRKTFTFLFFVLLLTFVYADDTNVFNQDINYEQINTHIQDNNLSEEDIYDYIEEHDLNYEDVQGYVDEYDIDYDQINQLPDGVSMPLVPDIDIDSGMIIDFLHENLDLLKELYNLGAQEAEIPSLIKSIYKNESYRVVLIKEDGQERYIFLDFEDNLLKNLTQEQVRDKVSVSFYVSHNVFDYIKDLAYKELSNISQEDYEPDYEQMVKGVKELFKNKDINIKPHGLWNNIKYNYLTIFKLIMSF